ncbi:MAG: acyl-CoA dehydrogenase family protein [Conexibacter sp.]
MSIVASTVGCPHAGIGECVPLEAITLRSERSPSAAQVRHLWTVAGARGLLGSGAAAGPSDRERSLAVIWELGRLALLDLPYWMQSDVLAQLLRRFGSERQRELLEPMATGQLIMATALTEPAGGTDLFALTSSAMLDGDCYVLRADKRFVTNASIADVLLVSAQLNDGARGLFMVDRATPGVDVEPTPLGDGLQFLATGRVVCRDARIPIDALLGGSAVAPFQLASMLGIERVCLGVMCTSAAAASLERLTCWMAEPQGDRAPLLDAEAVQHELALLSARLDAVDALANQLASQYVDRGTVAVDRAASLKLEAAQILRRVVEFAERLSGARALLDRPDGTRLTLAAQRRAAIAQALAGGTPHALLEVIAAGLRLRSSHVHAV